MRRWHFASAVILATGLIVSLGGCVSDRGRQQAIGAALQQAGQSITRSSEEARARAEASRPTTMHCTSTPNGSNTETNCTAY